MAQLNDNSNDHSLSSTTRFVCISDTHSDHDFCLPSGDILLHSGDFTRNGTEQEIEEFLDWLKTLSQYRLKIIIVGNHEWHRFYTKKRYKKQPPPVEQLQSDKSLASDYGIIYLQDQSFQDPVAGWKFYGSGWLSELCKDPEEIRRHWSQIPTDTDIVLTHGPPYSILDKSTRTPHLGCNELLKCITTIVRPRLHVFGHVHGAHGQYRNDDMGRTLFINASICDSRFRATHSPIVIDLQK